MRHRAYLFPSLLIALLVGVLPQGCSGSDSTSEPSPGNTTDASVLSDASATCSMSAAQPLCQVCLNARCQADCLACEKGGPCDPTLACMKGPCSAECGSTIDASTSTGGAGGAGTGGASTGGAGGQSATGGSSTGGAATGGAGGGVPCPIDFGIPACNSCVDQSCLPQCTTCGNDPACVALVVCLRQCKSDLICEAQCRLEHTSAVGPAEQLWGTFGCVKKNCADECSGTPVCSLATAVPACDACINNSCFGTCDACANDANCKAIFDCMKSNCSVPYQKWCIEACVLQHPSGGTTLGDFWGRLATPGCVEQKCDSECSSASTSKCALSTGAIVCDTCIDAQCLTECNACNGNADCAAIWGCVKDKCAYPYSDVACVSGCTVQHVAGAQAFLAWWSGPTSCAQTKCGPLCK